MSRMRVCLKVLVVLLLAAGATALPARAFTLDKSLAGSGIDRIPVGDRDIAAAGGVAVMPDGRTVLSGYARQGDRTLGAIVRVTPTGDADPTFAADTSFPGTVFVNAAPAPEDAQKATVLSDGVLAPDGSIYAAGRIIDRPGEYEESGQAFVTHVLADGRPDPAFGSAGIVTINGQAAPQLLRAANDGSLFVLVVRDSPGTAAPATGIVKLTAAGVRDAGYGQNGTAALEAGENFFTAAQMAFDAQGRIVLAGTILQSSSVVPGVARVLPTGALDASFGGTPVPGLTNAGAAPVDDGLTSTKIDGLSPVVQSLAAIAVQPDGKLVVAGRGTTKGADIGLVGRYLANGKLDAAFGQKGFARFRGQKQADRKGHNFDTALTQVLIDGGRIVVAGTQDSVEDSVQVKQPASPGSVATRTSPDLLLAGLTSAGRLESGLSVVPAGAQRFSGVRRMVLAGDKIVVAGRAKSFSSSSDREPETHPTDVLLVRFGKGVAAPPAGPVTPGDDTTCATATVKVRSASLTGCFKTAGGVSTATEGVITLNGTRISLLSGSRLVATPSTGTIRTTTLAGGKGVARVSAATPGGAVVQLSKGPIDFTVPAGAGGTRAVAAGPPDPCKPIGKAIGTVSTQGVGNLLGFPLPGDAKLSVASGVTYLQVNVELPKPSFADARGCATLVTTSAGGLQLDSLDVAVGSATLGPLELGSIRIRYTGASDTWKGSLVLTLPLPADVKIGGDISFVSGDFGAANVFVEFPTAIPVFPLVGLKGVNGGIQIKPFTAIKAGVHFVAGPTILGHAAIDADFQGVVSFPGTPYAIAVDVSGTVKVVSIPIAGASVHYDSGGTFLLKGSAGFDAYVLGIDVDVEGGVQAPHFYVSGSAEADLGLGSIKVAGLISEVGAAACGGFVNPIKDAALGFSITWGGDADFFSNCDLSPFKTFFAPPTPSAPMLRADAFSPRAETEQTVMVAPGTKALGLKVSGDQTPLIDLVGPGGERIAGPTASSPGPVRPQEIVHSPSATIVSYRPSKATYVALTNPAPGAWKVVSQLGTAPIRSVARSTVLLPPRVSVKVGGKGRARTLAFTRTARPGETISFVERGRKSVLHRLGDVPAGARAGTIRFAPGAGAGGRRQIVAQVSQNGMPRTSIVVGSYLAPGPARPARPRAVKLRAVGTTAVRATWTPVPGARRYVVRFRLKDGHRATVIVKAGARPSATTPAFVPGKGGTVSVTAVGPSGLVGAKALGVLKPAPVRKAPAKRTRKR